MLMLSRTHEPRLSLNLSLPAARTLMWLVDRLPVHAPPGGDYNRLQRLKKEVGESLADFLDADMLYTLSDALASAADEQRLYEQQEVTL